MNAESGNGSSIVKCVEAVRLAGTAAGFYFVYDAHAAGDSTWAVRLLALTLGLGLCGTCAVESLFFAKATAREKGYDRDSDRVSPYQTQNALWFVAATVASVVVFAGYPTSRPASVTYLVLVTLFFGLSALNHAYQAIRHGNLTWQNLNRPFLFAALVAATVPILLSAA